MKRIALLVALVAVSGCATQSGVMPEGADSYLIINTADHWYSTETPADLKIEAHRQANAFCMGENKRHQTIDEKTLQPGMITDYAEYDLKFKCVVGTDTAVRVSGGATSHTRLHPDADLAVHTAADTHVRGRVRPGTDSAVHKAANAPSHRRVRPNVDSTAHKAVNVSGSAFSHPGADSGVRRVPAVPSGASTHPVADPAALKTADAPAGAPPP